MDLSKFFIRFISTSVGVILVYYFIYDKNLLPNNTVWDKFKWVFKHYSVYMGLFVILEIAKYFDISTFVFTVLVTLAYLINHYIQRYFFKKKVKLSIPVLILSLIVAIILFIFESTNLSG